MHVTFGVVPTTWHDLVQAVIAKLRSDVGGPGDRTIRVDTRATVKLSEAQEDWIDEKVENTLLDLDVETVLQELVHRRAGPATTTPSLSSALEPGSTP